MDETLSQQEMTNFICNYATYFVKPTCELFIALENISGKDVPNYKSFAEGYKLILEKYQEKKEALSIENSDVLYTDFNSQFLASNKELFKQELNRMLEPFQRKIDNLIVSDCNFKEMHSSYKTMLENEHNFKDAILKAREMEEYLTNKM